MIRNLKKNCRVKGNNPENLKVSEEVVRATLDINKLTKKKYPGDIVVVEDLY